MQNSLPGRIMKIAAVISGGDLHNRRGLLNAALSRVEHLEQIPGYDIDVFIINVGYERFSLKSFFEGGFRVSSEDYEGRQIKIIRRLEFKSKSLLMRKCLTAYYLFSKRRLSDWSWQKDIARMLKGYDVISAHSTDAAIAACEANRRFSIPYFVTWHGSDIHTIPQKDSIARELTCQAMRSAKCNFFVSRSLLTESEKITKEGIKDVLHNGVEDCFKTYDSVTKQHLKKKYDVEGQKVIAFAGNLREIKNAEILPDLFNGIRNRFRGNVVFWIIGDGELRETIEQKISLLGINCKIWGSIPHSDMPEFFNCVDILLLPSLNEGLPLVALEAISCGANVIGSKIGGIPEAIGDEYCVSFGDGFIERFVEKSNTVLMEDRRQSLPQTCSWKQTAIKEDEYLQSV